MTTSQAQEFTTFDPFEDTWGTSGQFSLSRSFSGTSHWQRSMDRWIRMDAEERAAPARPSEAATAFVLRPDAPQMEQLLDLIATAEAGSAGYDAVHMGARARPPKPPTRMTVGEIFTWIDATPRQPHAIGRYQFIPSTLARLITAAGIREDAVFSPALQSQLAVMLIEEAGYASFRAGEISRAKMMDNLAAVWAGLPLANGLSKYHGYAGNRATISRASFAAGMTAIYGAE